jgi:hypothetical protein
MTGRRREGPSRDLFFARCSRMDVWSATPKDSCRA